MPIEPLSDNPRREAETSSGAEAEIFKKLDEQHHTAEPVDEEARHSQLLKQAIFESIGAQILVLDGEGNIIDSNHRLRELAPLFGVADPRGNYLDICHVASTRGFDIAFEIIDGVRAILAGKRDTFRAEYLVPNRDREIWIALSATRLDGTSGAVLLHENITERKLLERQILEASEHERRRIGQDLHDGLCQQLSGTMLAAHALASSLRSQPQLQAHAKEIVGFLSTANEQARTLARGLHPVDLDAQGLIAALEQLAEATNRRVPCEYRGDHNLPIESADIAVNFYRIAQEAVTNAVKHANANHIEISLHRHGQHIVITVEDDGVGLREMPPRRNAGMGINIMRYRAGTLGAQFVAERRASGGTRIRCSMPLPASNEDE